MTRFSSSHTVREYSSSFIRCGYTGYFTLYLVRVTDISQGKFPVVSFHGYVRKIRRSAHDILCDKLGVLMLEVQERITMLMML